MSMISKRLGSRMLPLTAVLLATGLVAHADDGYDDFVYDNRGTIEVGVEANPVPVDGSGAVGSIGYSGERVCSFGGSEIPCSSGEGVWHGNRACYVSVNPEQELPEFSDIAPNITVMRCTSPGGGFYLFTQADAVVEPPPPDPEELARRAVDSMGLKPVEMGTFPESSRATRDLGYVGWNSWMWVKNPSETTWGPIAAVARLDGWSVRAVAHVDHVEWDMGDGSVVTCGKGTPWQTIWNRNEKSPDCGHMYERDGEYTITATAHWIVEWEGIGRSGTFELDLANSAPVRIAEIQVVNVPNRNR